MNEILCALLPGVQYVLDVTEDEKFYPSFSDLPVAGMVVCVVQRPGARVWCRLYIALVAGDVWILENMDLVMDVTGDGCIVYI